MAPAVTVGIVGASGTVGKYLVPAFLSNGNYSVTLLARKGGNAAALEAFAKQGAKIVEADFEDEADLTRALKGLEIVISAVGAPGRLAQLLLIKAAQAAGVRRFVPSEFGVDSARPGVREYFPALHGKYVVRDALTANTAGLEYTFIVTGLFLETTFTDFLSHDIANGKATVHGSPDVPFTLTSLVDIARWTAAALLDTASKNTTIYFKGEEFTWRSSLETIERATGQKLDVTYLSKADLDKRVEGAPGVWAHLLARGINDGWLNTPDNLVWPGQDAPSVTLAQFAKEGRWNWGA